MKANVRAERALSRLLPLRNGGPLLRDLFHSGKVVNSVQKFGLHFTWLQKIAET
jgi:hypothetical protein